MPSKTSEGKPTPRAAKPRPSATRSGTAPKTGTKGKPSAPALRGETVDPGPRRVDERIQSHGGWRAATLTAIRRMIHEADPDITEDCKWAKANNPLGTPVWSHAGIVCTGEAYQQVVKLTFARGAALPDPKKLFNASLEGNARRAIDIKEGDKPDAAAFKALIRAAAKANATPKAASKAKK